MALKNVWTNAVYPPIRDGTQEWVDDLADVRDMVKEIRYQFEKIPTNITVTITTTGGTGAQHGAQWTVEGQPGIDKVPVIFRATAGEVVTVTPAGQVPPPNPLVAPLPTLVPTGGGQGITVNFGDTTIANGMDLAAFEARVELAVGRAVRGV
jgi:secreted protein with Ig-like and vWFA domain